MKQYFITCILVFVSADKLQSISVFLRFWLFLERDQIFKQQFGEQIIFALIAYWVFLFIS